MSEQNQIFLSLREIIAGLINQDEREIKPESRFLEDLGIELEDAETGEVVTFDSNDPIIRNLYSRTISTEKELKDKLKEMERGK